MSASLVEQLNSWAGKNGLSDDPYVTAISAAISKKKNLVFWARINPIEYLPSASNSIEVLELRLSRLLAAIRNLIIFVPVAITWAAVAEATTAFNEFVQTSGGTPANFLQFWQDGYGVLDPFWSIGNIARLDFYIVGLVILLSAVISSLQGRGLSKIKQAREDFASTRRLLALELAEFLSSYEDIASKDIPAQALRSIESLRDAVKQSGLSIQVLSETTNKLSKFIPALDSTSQAFTKQMDTVAKGIDKIGKDLENQMSRLATELEISNSAFKSSTRAVQDQLENLQRQNLKGK